jgi:hypothetical protein
MNPPSELTGAHLRTFQTIFQHPASHNLGWHDVHALLRRLGEVEETANGNFKVTRGGEVLVLPTHRTKDVSTTDELLKLRHFLERSQKASVDAVAPESRWLLVINHHVARIFRSEAHGTTAEDILPQERSENARGNPDFTRGGEQPDPHSFFPVVAKALKEAGQLLVFGSGTGLANEMNQFVGWLRIHDFRLFARVSGAVVIDEHHLTDAQLLAKARAFYA